MGRSGWTLTRCLASLSITTPRYYDWKARYGKANIDQQRQPKSHWLLAEERQAIVNYAKENPQEGYRRLSYMLLDANVAAASPVTVYRVLKEANMLNEARGDPSKKGTGFNQPSAPHHHWHSDISYINIAGTFFYFISVLDGYSRYMVQWELKQSMTEKDVEMVVQRSLEKHPGVKPRIISDNGKQYTSHDFKKFVRTLELTQATTSPYYPQSNGKIERFHRTLKADGIKHGDLLSFEVANDRISQYVDYYNSQRLHAAIGYITPKDKLNGREEVINKLRQERLDTARKKRKAAAKMKALQRKNSLALEDTLTVGKITA